MIANWLNDCSNRNRAALSRAISRTIIVLRGLQELNAKSPAHYPTIQESDGFMAPERDDPNPKTTSERGESSKVAEQTESLDAPRLVTPQLRREFSVLKLDLRLGSASQKELVQSLEKSSIASLLDGKIDHSVRHLLALRERIEDTSSKVLITGDLNAGKSTLCNALLRREILPVDQQPCTSIFCEVLDVGKNEGVEEVHALHKETTYDRKDESTYDIYKLEDLEHIVVESAKYTQAKVYVKDVRTAEQSLLNNGVVDISIIDAPGLNKDSLKTTAIFARQEEIDVVVFVVSAENHFTLSAQEFIKNATSEKALMFMVVNRFDNIRDQDRCKRVVLGQVKELSPRTFKESTELVHFVSSNVVPTAPLGARSSGGDGDGPGDGPGDNDDDDPKGKGKGKAPDRAKMQDFEDLEESLRRFVLDRRARSKLAPAKTYLLNMLSDMIALAEVNCDIAKSEIEQLSGELTTLEPLHDQRKKAHKDVNEDLDSTIEESGDGVYRFTRSELNSTIARLTSVNLGIPYPGLFGAVEYAESLKAEMLSQISEAITRSEQHARECTISGVSSITSLGLRHLGNEYHPLTFRADTMFKQRRNHLARTVDIDIDLFDFVSIPTLVQDHEKIAGTGVVMTLGTVLSGQITGGFGWIDGVLKTMKLFGSRDRRSLILPSLLVLTVGAVAFVLHQIPTVLPRRLQAKLSAALAEQDFVHKNSERVAGESRKVLRYPADQLRVGLHRSVEDIARKRESTRKAKKESDVAMKYFSNLVNESRTLASNVNAVDLESFGGS